jgi:hypothetical protein
MITQVPYACQWRIFIVLFYENGIKTVLSYQALDL